MEVKNITPGRFQTIVANVSRTHYDGNVIVGWGDYGPTLLNEAGTRWRGRVLVKSSRGKGARRSWSGRRIPAACWHVFRDVVRATLTQRPEVVFRTAMARYDAATFEQTYPATGTRNIGSAMQPVTMPELCECGPDRRLSLARIEAARQALAAEMSVSADQYVRTYVSRVDAVLSVVAGKCGWCGWPTGSDASVWCSQSCQERWQEKYALSP